jgi:hypothetical protein
MKSLIIYLLIIMVVPAIECWLEEAEPCKNYYIKRHNHALEFHRAEATHLYLMFDEEGIVACVQL